MNRRKFLGLSIFSVFLTGVPSLLFMGVNEKPIIVSVLRRHLKSAGFQEKDFVTFTEAYINRLREQNKLSKYKFRLRILSITKGIYERGWFDSVNQIERFEEHIITKFLLSSDYFLKNNPPYTFVYLYDPSVQPCSNIFRKYSES